MRWPPPWADARSMGEWSPGKDGNMVRVTVTLLWTATLGVVPPLASQAPPSGDPWASPASWEVETREIEFESAGVRLVGTLHLPSGGRHVPAVVVTHGGGDNAAGRRDTPLYGQLAETFPALGIAVLVYDRRGAGASEGEPVGDYGVLARDAVAAKRAVGREEEIDGGSVGFWGLSQGGWIAMEAGAMSDPAFVISVSAPLTTPGLQMQELAHNMVLREGHGEAAAGRARETREKLDAYFRAEIEYSDFMATLQAAHEEPWYDLLFLPSPEEIPATQEEVEGSRWIHEMAYDPVEAYRNVGAPMLFVLGGNDFVIPVAQTLEIMSLLPETANYQWAVLPGHSHTMRIGPDPEFPPDLDVETLQREYRDQLVSNSPLYFLMMGNWLGALRLGAPLP